jgi:type IV pilus modification protein PilV
MVEMLVAILLTAVGFMGFAALQTRALLAAEDTYMRTQAMALAQEMLERKRINGSTEMYLDRAIADPALQRMPMPATGRMHRERIALGRR